MHAPASRAEEILDVAERMARTGGYHGFSFREIAKRIGIKAASVHYHFPGKEDLGAAVARRYTDRFLAALGAPDDADVPPDALLRRYVGAFRSALVDEGLMCLCGVLGAEIAHLPAPVADEARHFFQANIAWLDAVLDRRPNGLPPERRRAEALRIIATLEGAMILAKSLNDPDVFDAATDTITADV